MSAPEQSDILQVEGINSKGFGTIPKLVMQDRRLTAQAKAIYSYFASYAGAGQTAFPSRTKITEDLGISLNTYYRHFELLRKYGYIKAQQEKGEKGKFNRNLYTLLADIPIDSPCIQNEDTAPCINFGDTHFPYTQDEYTNSNSLKNKQFSINNSLSSPSALAQSEPTTDGQDVEQRIENYTELIHDNIAYEDFLLAHPYDMGLVDEIVSVIVDVLVSDSSHVRIDGEDKPRALVKHVFMKLDYGNVELVLGQFKSLTEHIRKKRQYFITMLYNSRLELDAHYTNEVQCDFGGV